MNSNYLIYDVNKKFAFDIINIVKNKLQLYPQKKIVFNVKDSLYLDANIIRQIKQLPDSNRFFIRIEGGYDKERIKNYPDHEAFHKYDNIYTIEETLSILEEITIIENGIKPNWSEEEKLIYIINELKNKIIYHPFHEEEKSKEIRSLRGLISGRTVCAGYALIFKEFCDRNNIECQYVEGACQKEDQKKGIRNHAWNIVKLKGNYIPIDLTWNAGAAHRGNTLSTKDLANVNEFVEHHYPGYHEKLQDYQHQLKSLDGHYVSLLEAIICRDHQDCIKKEEIFTRKDGTKFLLKQKNEKIIENELVYKYLIYELDSNNIPLSCNIVYSKTNINGIRNLVHNKRKLLKQLETAKQQNNKSEIDRITKLLQGSEWLNNSYHHVSNILFSRNNIEAAKKRNDFYLGEIEVDKTKGQSHITGITIDPTFGRKINAQNRVIKRRDGTHFILEKLPPVTIDTGNKVFRYNIYELINSNGITKLHKNMIFTDEEILFDYRDGIADVLLSRQNIKEGAKESCGYLGNYSKEGIKKYNSNTKNYFTKRLYSHLYLSSDKIKDYYNPITFNEMKRLVKNFEYQQNGKEWIIVNKNSKRPLTDEDLILRFKFANLWLSAAGTKWMGDDIVPGYYYAYGNENSEKVFDFLFKEITNNINKNGNINSLELLDTIEKNSTYKHASSIIIKFFSSQRNIDIINTIFRLQNPSAKPSNKRTEVLQDNYGPDGASAKLAAYREDLERIKKRILEVKEINSHIEIKPKM